MSPTARSTEYLRKRGYTVCRVEQTLNMPGRPFGFKKDAFGFGDLLACSSRPGIAGVALVQVTSTGNVGKRCEKIRSDPKVFPPATEWLRSGGRIEVHGWAKRGPRGKRKRWSIAIKAGQLNGDSIFFSELEA